VSKKKTIDRYRLEWAANTTIGNGARRLLVKLSVVSGVLPTEIRIRNIQCVSPTPDCLGSFADIYCGKYEGKVVALKVLREMILGRDRLVVRKVR
jgi:hypothetical protein